MPHSEPQYALVSAATQNANELQTLTVGGVPTGGTFTLSFAGATTAPITWVGNTANLITNIDAALESLATIGAGGVTTADIACVAGIGTLGITFTGPAGNVPLTVADDTLVVGTAGTASVAVSTPGVAEIQTLTIANATGGTFTLAFGGQTTDPITWSAVNATLLANIDAALEALTTIGAGGVTVADSTLAAGLGDLTVTFVAPVGNVAILVADVTALAGAGAAVTPAQTVQGVAEIQTLTIGGLPTGGTFTLEYDGSTTAPITWVANTGNLIANIDAALEAMANIGVGGVVTADIACVNGIGTLGITFAGLTGPVVLLVADDALLVGTAGTVAVAETTPGATNTVVAAVAGKKIRVLGYQLNAAGAVNAKFTSLTSPATDLTGLMRFAAAGSQLNAIYSPVGWFETTAGAALGLNLSGAVAVSGHIVYVLV